MGSRYGSASGKISKVELGIQCYTRGAGVGYEICPLIDYLGSVPVNRLFDVEAS
jgi:hypothetical protein